MSEAEFEFLDYNGIPHDLFVDRIIVGIFFFKNSIYPLRIEKYCVKTGDEEAEMEAAVAVVIDSFGENNFETIEASVGTKKIRWRPIKEET